MADPRVRESDLLRWIRGQAAADASVLVGIGDDAALVRNARPASLVTTDLLIEGVHFESAAATPRDVGWKAMARNVSDIAAMGGRSTFAVVAAALPEGYPQKAAEALVGGLLECANAFDIRLVGGDLAVSPGPLALAVTLLGDPGRRQPILRSGAEPGDAILVTGTLGGALLGRHLRFTPRQAEGIVLAERYKPHAMIDISDGLARDLHHILEESGVGARLRADHIPISDDARRAAAASGRAPLQHALADGEDYELLFTADDDASARLLAEQPLPVPVTRIGTITTAAAILVMPDGTERPLHPEGWEHATCRDARRNRAPPPPRRLGTRHVTVTTNSTDETIALGRRLGQLLGPGDVVALRGPLGSGKTTLTKGIAAGLGVPEPRWVTSPTFVLVHQYEGRVPVYHVDAYRLRGAADAEALGSDEMFFGDGVVVVEWAERIAGALPDERLDIALEHAGEERRRLTFEPHGERYAAVLRRLTAPGATGRRRESPAS